MNATDPAPELTGQPLAAPPFAVQLPGCERRLAYAAHYWPATLLNLLRPHRLQPAVPQPRLSAPVTIPAPLRRGWETLFDTDARCPLLTNQSVGTLLYTRLFAQLGLNFRQLLHVQHRTQHLAGAAALAGAQSQRLVCELHRCWRLPDGKALVVLQTAIARPDDEGGGLLARVEDRFLIRRVPRPDWEQLPAVTQRAQVMELVGLRRRRAALQAGAPGVSAVPLQLASDLGRRYGCVSGDHNPVHTTALAARLFGLRRPFAQGLALRNLVVSELHRRGLPLQRLQLSFAQPAYLGQAVTLLLHEGAFELQDGGGQVLLFGSAEG